MNISTRTLHARTLICAAAIGAFALSSNPIFAASHDVTVSIPVTTAGLDPSRPSDARSLYIRLQNAADRACTTANIVGLEPVHSYHACYENAMGNAVRSAHLPQLTAVYLSVHTARQAALYGIEAPVRVAANQ
jgi:UrcA family protein